MFWILNSHQTLATRSCALTWAPWCKLPYAVPESSLIPLLLFSSVPPFFPWSSLFFLCELFLQTVQCFSCCLLMRCQLCHFRHNHFVVIILAVGYESFLYYFLAPLQIFITWFSALSSSTLFLFNLRSVDHVVFYEAWWMWRLPKLVGIWERGTVLIMQWRHKRGRWGPGRIIIKVLYGEVLHRSPNTYSLLYTISAKKAPLLYTFYRQTGTPFTYLV